LLFARFLNLMLGECDICVILIFFKTMNSTQHS
jgi:hypothetical protein